MASCRGSRTRASTGFGLARMRVKRSLRPASGISVGNSWYIQYLVMKCRRRKSAKLPVVVSERARSDTRQRQALFLDTALIHCWQNHPHVRLALCRTATGRAGAQLAIVAAMAPRRGDGILLVAHGTVDDLDDLPEFLAEIRRGQPAPQSLVEE